MTDYVLLLSLAAVLVFILFIVPVLKILAMIDVFGWNKTRELLHNPDWYKGGKKP